MLASPFESIKVSLRPPKAIYVAWVINPTFTGKAPYNFKFQVFQDMSFTEPVFEKNVGEDFFAIDDSNLRQNLLGDYVYRIILTTADGKEYISPFVDYGLNDGADKHRWLMANEMTRKNWVGLWRFGLNCYLLKRKIYAPAALNEVDPVTGEPIVDNSSGSIGVGMLNGYHKPVLTRYWLTGGKQQMDYQQEGRGVNYREDLNIWTIGFPPFNSHDILVTVEGRRYMVQAPNYTYFPGTTIVVKQEINLQIIPPTDTVYTIPIPEFPPNE